MTEWYQLPNDTVLGLILIILRSRTVIKITAGKIFHMSIQTFGVVSIMKILTIIINITSRNKIKLVYFLLLKKYAKSTIYEFTLYI